MVSLNSARDVFEALDDQLRPVQDMVHLDELYETAPICHDRLIRLGWDMEPPTRGNFVPGPIKEREVAENKIKRELNGRPELLCDVVRGKLIIDTPQGIISARELLRTDGTLHRIFAAHKTRSIILGDHFSEPKMETGYRCLNAKIAIPAISDEELMDLDLRDTETLIITQTVELQVVHQAIEDVYDKTHGHMREAQNIYTQYAHEKVPNDQALRAAGHYAVCKYYNGKAARDAGLDPLLSDPMYALTDKQAQSLKKMMRGYDCLPDPGFDLSRN